MTDATTLLAASVLVLCLCATLLATSVPALWWLHLRQAARMDQQAREVAELRKDLQTMDEVVDGVAIRVRQQQGVMG